jgi:hypothetical protein
LNDEDAVTQSFEQLLWLKKLNNIKSLIFSDIENWERNWVCMKKKWLYKLKECNSLYKKHIVNICSENNCSKIKVINEIKNETITKKTVFCFMNFTNALILYWVCSTLLFTQATITIIIDHQIRQLLTCNNISNLC